MIDTTQTGADSLDWQLALEQAKIPKLKIIFGDWWRHYAVPYEFRSTLYSEHAACPYCGGSLGPLSTSDSPGDKSPEQSAHLDHMDPLSKGGEDSIRNAVYACAQCNLGKRGLLFIVWLEKLSADNREKARSIYVSKHGHQPDEFEPTSKQSRLALPRIELKFSELVLRKLFPKPIVSGPPRRH